MTELEALNHLDTSAKQNLGYTYAAFANYAREEGLSYEQLEEAWRLGVLVAKRLGEIWTYSRDTLTHTAMNHCVNCRRHFDEHARGGKCLFDHTRFEPFLRAVP